MLQRAYYGHKLTFIPFAKSLLKAVAKKKQTQIRYCNELSEQKSTKEYTNDETNETTSRLI